MRTTLLVAGALLASTGTVLAQPAHEPYAPPRQEAIQSPDRIVERGIDRLSGYLVGAGDPSPKDLRAFLDEAIAPYFDFAYMARWAAGPYYRRLTDDQRGRLTAKLRNLFLDALARNLGSYARPLPRVDVYPARRGRSPAEARVDALVTTGAAPPIRLQFRFYWAGEKGWRVFDVSADGASADMFYRGWFGHLFRRFGPEGALR